MNNLSKFYDLEGNIITEKKCLKCLNIKSFSEFKHTKSGKYNLHNWCSACLSTYNKQKYEENKDIKKRKIELWNIENNDKTKEYKRKWYYKKNGKTMPERKERKEKNPLDNLPPIDPELNF